MNNEILRLSLVSGIGTKLLEITWDWFLRRAQNRFTSKAKKIWKACPSAWWFSWTNSNLNCDIYSLEYHLSEDSRAEHWNVCSSYDSIMNFMDSLCAVGTTDNTDLTSTPSHPSSSVIFKKHEEPLPRTQFRLSWPSPLCGELTLPIKASNFQIMLIVYFSIDVSWVKE